MILYKIKNLTQLILDLAVSALFILVSMFVLKFVLTFGPTSVFLERSYKLIGIGFVSLTIIFICFFIKDKNFQLKKKFDLPQFKDFLLISLPMSPVIGVSIINIEYLDTFGLLHVIGIPFVFSFLLSFVFPSFFSYFSSFKILMISGLALSFTILTMPSITSNPNGNLFNSLFITQIIYLFTSFAVMSLLYLINSKIAYTVAITFMLTGVTGNLFDKFYEKGLAGIEKADRLKIFIENDKNKIIDKKNIYIMTYESYPNLETLEHYGFDNNNQIKYLENNNYTIYHGTYSNAASSLDSISRLFDINGNISNSPRYYTSGNAFGLNVFKANGYKTKTLFNSPYFFSSYPITWDEYYPKADVSKLGGKIITKAIYEGEFRFDIFGDNYSNEKYLELKKIYLSSKPKKPTLFYTHNNYPGHSNNSGKCSPNEKENYFVNLKKANIEMKNDIDTLKKNDPNAIIVLLGDHGPYLTKNCTELRNFKLDLIDKYDVQDRYGTFLAINWPDEVSFEGNNIEIVQDILPAILETITENKDLFNELKVDRKFFDRFDSIIGGVNVLNGVIKGGKDNGKPLFEKRLYQINN